MTIEYALRKRLLPRPLHALRREHLQILRHQDRLLASFSLVSSGIPAAHWEDLSCFAQWRLTPPSFS